MLTFIFHEVFHLILVHLGAIQIWIHDWLSCCSMWWAFFCGQHAAQLYQMTTMASLFWEYGSSHNRHTGSISPTALASESTLVTLESCHSLVPCHQLNLSGSTASVWHSQWLTIAQTRYKCFRVESEALYCPTLNYSHPSVCGGSFPVPWPDTKSLDA